MKEGEGMIIEKNFGKIKNGNNDNYWIFNPFLVRRIPDKNDKPQKSTNEAVQL